MKAINFDQYEFGDPSSEERTEIKVAIRSGLRFPDIESFAIEVAGKQAIPLPAPKAWWELRNRDGVAFLLDHAGIEVPSHCTWQCYVVEDVGHTVTIVFDARERFISYNWMSTA